MLTSVVRKVTSVFQKGPGIDPGEGPGQSSGNDIIFKHLEYEKLRSCYKCLSQVLCGFGLHILLVVTNDVKFNLILYVYLYLYTPG